jgi:hypothetical protein
MPLIPSRLITTPLVGGTSTGDRFVLTLDGVVCGLVTSAEGGNISAPVLREPAGAFVPKRLGAPTPEPIDLFFDLSLQKVVYEWITESWQGRALTKSGSLITLDTNLQATTELQFDKAVISATTIPAMDASSKLECVLAVRLTAAATNMRHTSGPIAGLVPKQKKAWLSSNFRLEIDGLDTTTISKVNALTIMSAERNAAADRSRWPAGSVSAIDFPDLRVLFAEQSLKTWADWHDRFVVHGENDDTQEKSGSLVFLAPDRQSQLGNVAFYGLGIYRLRHEPAQLGEPVRIRRTVAELYCQRMELVV